MRPRTRARSRSHLRLRLVGAVRTLALGASFVRRVEGVGRRGAEMWRRHGLLSAF
jgi:hypothetical protein